MSGVRLRRKLLQAPDAIVGESVHRPHKLRRRSGELIIEALVRLQDTRRLGSAKARLKLRAENQGNLAKKIAGGAHSKLAFDAIDELDDLDCPLDHDEQSRRLAFIDRVLSGIQMDVRSRSRDIRQSDRRKRGKDRNHGKFVWRQHALPALPAQRENAGALCGGVRRSVKATEPRGCA